MINSDTKCADCGRSQREAKFAPFAIAKCPECGEYTCEKCYAKKHRSCATAIVRHGMKTVEAIQQRQKKIDALANYILELEEHLRIAKLKLAHLQKETVQ